MCPAEDLTGVVAAPQQARYQWKMAEDGKAVLWYTKGMGLVTARLGLADILAHPDARISLLGGG